MRVGSLLQVTARIASALALSSLICLSVRAQRDRDTWTTASPSSFEVSGQIRLAASGLPAAKIPIRLERFGGGIVDQIDTDGSGRFRFPSLQRGYYKVVVSVPGFRPLQQDADLQVIFRVHLILDLVADSSNNRSNAAAVIDVVDANAPAAARDRFSRARSAFARKDYNSTIAELDKALSIYPTYYAAHLLLATALMDSRDWNKAEAALHRALEIRPEDKSILLSLGEVYWRQKRFDEAEKLLLETLQADDEAWQGFFTLARLYWEKNDVMKAAPAIGHTLQLRPDFAEAHLLAGNILLKLNQRERAIVEYQEYLRLAPKGEFANESRELLKRLNAPLAR